MLSVLRAVACRVAAVIAECNYAQRRLAVLQVNPNAYLLNLRQAPDTYREFLLWTSGPLLREPSAAKRSFGHAVR